ncbi:MAG TPA: hypothetical protein VGG79_08570 [Roseiarcus sp.]|jgi:hypothetical protein
MSAISIGGRGCGATISRVAAEWLGLAAAPTFLTMALMTTLLGGGAEPLCSAAHAGSPFEGMAPMYLLMGAFHVAPWLRLVASRRR